MYGLVVMSKADSNVGTCVCVVLDCQISIFWPYFRLLVVPKSRTEGAQLKTEFYAKWLWHWKCHAGMWNEVRMIVKSYNVIFHCNFLTKKFFSTDRFKYQGNTSFPHTCFEVSIWVSGAYKDEECRYYCFYSNCGNLTVCSWLVAIQTPRAQSITYWIVENYCAFISVLGYIPLSSAYPREPIKTTKNNTTVIICEPQTK